jgi:hypothetical protein
MATRGAPTRSARRHDRQGARSRLTVIRLDCGQGLSVLVAPLLRTGDTVRTLPDLRARVRVTGASVEARWPDGVVLQLRATRGPHWRLAVRAGSRKNLVVDALGTRLLFPDATRLLVDGYHSWDWAGTRDATVPGHGWWGAIWGSPGGSPALAVALDAAPSLGALSLAWDGEGHLDATSVGDPVQLRDASGEPTPLRRRVRAGEVLSADALSVGRVDRRLASGAGVPRLRPGDRRPRPRRAGWMSWNCLGPDVCGADVVDAAATLVPEGGIALLDDGWMSRWGDWDERDDFDMFIADLAAAVTGIGRVLGLWVAPFVIDQGSYFGSDHPDLMLKGPGGEPLVHERPPAPKWTLDASSRKALAYLAWLGRRLGHLGVGALKIDFLYAGAVPGNRNQAMSGVRALRRGVKALVDAYRSTAPRGAVVWACGAPAPPLVGLVDSCRSGGDAVINVPAVRAAPPPRPWFVHGETILRAQTRNLAARSWLWGSTMPPDFDAVTMGSVGLHEPVDDLTLRAWLELAVRGGGSLLDSDEPSGSSVGPDRLEQLRRAQLLVSGRPSRPVRPLDPLELAPASMTDDNFLSWPAELPDEWEPFRPRSGQLR